MHYKLSQHSYDDADLISASAFSQIVGVSCAAITKAKQSGRVDTFENKKHKECFHRILSPQQYSQTRDRRHVTIPTQGQKKAGFDNLTAQAVAHNPNYDVPTPGFGFAVPGVTDVDEPLDFASASAERADLATSKAQREFQNARLAKLRADEMEGRLVPKQQAAIIAYQIGANIQEKIMTLYSQLAPEIVGYFKELMTRGGLSNEQIAQITGDADHYVGEKIRQSCLKALKDLTDKTADNILDG